MEQEGPSPMEAAKEEVSGRAQAEDGLPKLGVSFF